MKETGPFGRNVRELRFLNNMSQTDLADAIGVKPPTIANIEGRGGNASLTNALAIAKVLGTTIEELMKDSPCRHSRIAWLLPGEYDGIVCNDCGFQWYTSEEEWHG